MVASYPGAYPDFLTPGAFLDTDAKEHDKLHLQLSEELAAALTALGLSPAGSDAAVKARLGRLDSMTSGQVTSDGVSVTYGTGPTTVLTAIIPATGYAGRLSVWGAVTINKSAPVERWAASLEEATLIRGIDYGSEAQTIVTLSPSGTFSTTGAAAHNVGLRLTRSTGSGSASSIESPNTAQLIHWIFIPT